MRSVLIKICIKLITFSYTQIPGLSVSLFNALYLPDWTDSMIKIINQFCGKSNLYSCGNETGVTYMYSWWSFVMGLQSHFLFKDLASSYTSQDKAMNCVSSKKNNACYVPHLNNIVALTMKGARSNSCVLMKSGSIN